MDNFYLVYPPLFTSTPINNYCFNYCLTFSFSELEDDLQGAEARCNLLEKQLDYMRKMVQTAETDRDTAIQRSAMVAKQAAQQTNEDIRGQLDKLAGLERDHMKLTAQHSIAEVNFSLLFIVLVIV